MLVLVLMGCAPLLLVALGGCDFTWDVGTRPDPILSNGSKDPQWTAWVEEASMEWTGPLVLRGCRDPFSGPSTQPVILVPDAEWPDDSSNGHTEADEIIVEGTVEQLMVNHAYQSVIVHELGHALGLVHVPETEDSVMHSPNNELHPSKEDLDNVAVRLGC